MMLDEFCTKVAASFMIFKVTVQIFVQFVRNNQLLACIDFVQGVHIEF